MPHTDLFAHFDKHDITLIIHKKAVKNVNFRLTFISARPCFAVSVPRHLSDGDIHRLIMSKSAWAMAHAHKRKHTHADHSSSHAHPKLWGEPFDVADYLTQHPSGYQNSNAKTPTPADLPSMSMSSKLACLLWQTHGNLWSVTLPMRFAPRKCTLAGAVATPMKLAFGYPLICLPIPTPAPNMSLCMNCAILSIPTTALLFGMKSKKPCLTIRHGIIC